MLGKKREVVVGGVAVLVSFDVLEDWAEIKIVQGVTDFIEDVPVGGKGSRWRGVTEERWKGVKWGPIFVKQGSSGKRGLECNDFVDKR